MDKLIYESSILENDLRKVHAEVVQICSQRFQLITSAILVFAAVCGWATSAASEHGFDVKLACVLILLVLMVLTAIFTYFMLLLRMMRIFTTYLVEKYGSHWETDWREYRQQFQKYAGYSKAGTLVFAALGVLAFGFLLGLCWSIDKFEFGPGVIVTSVFVVLYVVGVLIAGWWRRSWLINEHAIFENWQTVIQRAGTTRRVQSCPYVVRELRTCPYTDSLPLHGSKG